MARAAVRARLLHPRLLVLVVVVGVLGGAPLATSGHRVGGVVQGLLSVVFIGAVVVATSYRRALVSATTLCPAGATLTADLADDALLVRTAAGEQHVLYSSLRAPRRVAGQVLLPLRDVRAHLTLPAPLLTPQDVEWLAWRIDRPAPALAPAEQAADVHAWPHEVALTDAVVRRVSRAVVRYRLLGRAGAVRAVLVVLLWLWLGVVTGRWLPATGVVIVVTTAAVIASVVRMRRALRRSAGAQRRVRARFDDTHLHLDGDLGRGSLAYSALRRCVVDDGTVLLLTRTGVLEVLPRELVPDDALARLQHAAGAGARAGSTD